MLARRSISRTALQRGPVFGSQHVAAARRLSVTRAIQDEESTAIRSTNELRNAGPDPKKFSVADGELLKIAAAASSFIFRMGSGAFAMGYSAGLVEEDGKYGVVSVGGRRVSETSQVSQYNRPAQTLELYEFEGCPFCKKVREAITMLDLDVLVYPCPKDGATWRPKAITLGGKKQFPFLVDPNSGKQMYESDEIIKYLFNTYGPGEVPLTLRLGGLTTLTCGLALAPRAGAGSAYKKSRVPEKPLVFWGYEASPFVKVVREVLCELELPYLQRTAGRGSPKRQELLDKRGHFQVPYLEDPNTGVYLFESKAISKYLQDTYAVPSASTA